MPKKVRIIVKIICIALFILIASFTKSKASDTEKSITFADKELYNSTKEYIQKYRQDSFIGCNDDENTIIADITKLTSLLIHSENGITDLSGIEGFTFVTTLSISNNYNDSGERTSRYN